MSRGSDPQRRQRSAASFMVLALPWAIAGCGTPAPRSQSGDLGRRIVPPPACVLRLPGRNASAASVRKLTNVQLWGLVFSNFDAASQTVPEDAIDCRGGHPFSEAAFRRAEPIRGWPFPATEDDVTYASGPSHLQIVWLRTHRYADETTGGVLAFIRATGDLAELYSIGAYRGEPARVKIRAERMGSDYLPTVQQDGCLKAPVGTPCETTLTVYRSKRGKLVPAIHLVTERVAFATGTEPGVPGRLEYHLVATPTVRDDGIDVAEQLTVADEQGRQVRTAQVKRVFQYSQVSGFSPSEPSLWETVYVASTREADAEAPPRASP